MRNDDSQRDLAMREVGALSSVIKCSIQRRYPTLTGMDFADFGGNDGGGGKLFRGGAGCSDPSSWPPWNVSG
jgi:hypothetical protein